MGTSPGEWTLKQSEDGPAMFLYWTCERNHTNVERAGMLTMSHCSVCGDTVLFDGYVP